MLYQIAVWDQVSNVSTLEMRLLEVVSYHKLLSSMKEIRMFFVLHKMESQVEMKIFALKPHKKNKTVFQIFAHLYVSNFKVPCFPLYKLCLCTRLFLLMLSSNYFYVSTDVNSFDETEIPPDFLQGSCYNLGIQI